MVSSLSVLASLLCKALLIMWLICCTYFYSPHSCTLSSFSIVDFVVLLICAGVESTCRVQYTWGGRHICSWAYADNVKGIYISVSRHIVSCTEFIWGIYADVAASHLHELFSYVTFQGCACCEHMYGNSMVKRSCNFFTYMCHLYVDYSSSVVGHVCAMWESQLFRGIFQ